MIDQAETLRRLMQLRKGIASASRGEGPRIVTFTSGGPGEGKSAVIAHMGALLARAGHGVLVANSEWVRPAYALDAYSPEAGLPRESYVASAEPGLYFGHFSEAFYSACNSTGLLEHGAAHVREQLGIKVDFVLLEAGRPGSAASIGHVQRPEFVNVILVTPDARGLARAKELVSGLRREMGLSRVGVIVNKVDNVGEGRKVFKGLADFADRLADVRLEYLGCVPREEKIARALVSRKFLVDLSRGDSSGSSSAAHLRLVTKRLESWGLTGDLAGHSLDQSRTRSVYGRTGV